MSKRKPKSEFRAGFEEQHGKRNGCAIYTLPLHKKTDQQLEDMVNAGEQARHALSRRKTYDRQEWSALAAWSAARSKEVQP